VALLFNELIFCCLISNFSDGITSRKAKHESYYDKGTQTSLSVIYRKYGAYKKLNVLNSIQNLKILLSPNIFKTNNKP